MIIPTSSMQTPPYSTSTRLASSRLAIRSTLNENSDQPRTAPVNRYMDRRKALERSSCGAGVVSWSGNAEALMLARRVFPAAASRTKTAVRQKRWIVIGNKLYCPIYPEKTNWLSDGAIAVAGTPAHHDGSFQPL